MQFPKQIQLEVVAPPILPGAVGLVQAVGVSAAAQGADVDLDEWLCVSSSALMTYAFDPKLNRHEASDRHFSADGEWFSNYGVLESLGYFSGWHARDLNGPSTEDLWKLVRYELALGRPLVSQGFGGKGVVLLTGYRDLPGVHEVTVTDGSTTWTFNLQNPPQGDSEVFVNYIITVRQGEPGLTSRSRQIEGVLRWTIDHGFGSKEFFHETRENYVPGLAGGEVISRLRLEDAEEVEFFKNHVASRRRGREAASRVLGRWAELLEMSALEDAAKAFGESALCLDGTMDGYQRALVSETEAFTHLKSIQDRLPPAFG